MRIVTLPPLPSVQPKHIADLRQRITEIGSLTRPCLDATSLTLSLSYEMFCEQPGCVGISNPFEGFKEMLLQWSPWVDDDSTFVNLTLADFLLAWAWHQLDDASFFLGKDPMQCGWTVEESLNNSAVAFKAAEESVAYAEQLRRSTSMLQPFASNARE
jgi:hypothetical protein